MKQWADLNNSSRSHFTHVLYGILVTEPVRTFHRVIEMPLPFVILGITQRRVDPALVPAQQPIISVLSTDPAHCTALTPTRYQHNNQSYQCSALTPPWYQHNNQSYQCSALTPPTAQHWPRPGTNTTTSHITAHKILHLLGYCRLVMPQISNYYQKVKISIAILPSN